jgi:predicted nucleic acid-binding Zn ribbon protein
MPPKRKSVVPRQGEALLDGLFRRLGLEKEARSWRALQAWQSAAGPKIAERARAERVQGTTLILRVTSAAWANELGYLKGQLLERLQETPGADWITELRFSVGPLEGAPGWEGDLPIAAPSPPTPELPPVDDGEVAAALREVGDPELRGALAELFARARHRPQ